MKWIDPSTQARVCALLAAIGRVLVRVGLLAGWFVREEGVTVLTAALLTYGAAMFRLPLGLIVAGLCLKALEIKTEVDWRYSHRG